MYKYLQLFLRGTSDVEQALLGGKSPLAHIGDYNLDLQSHASDADDYDTIDDDQVLSAWRARIIIGYVDRVTSTGTDFEIA